MSSLIYIVTLAFDIAVGVIIAQVAFSWLIAFNVINAQNPAAQNLLRLLKKITDPVYKPLRKYIPFIGGIDITPIVVLIGLAIAERMLLGLLFSI